MMLSSNLRTLPGWRFVPVGSVALRVDYNHATDVQSVHLLPCLVPANVTTCEASLVWIGGESMPQRTLSIIMSNTAVDAAIPEATSNAEIEREGLELSVVMPCLNEELTVGICVEKAMRTMRELGIEGEVVVVDNGSTDNSVEIATGEGARVVHENRKGYGNALRRGFEEARGKYIIMGDCDDSYDFTDLKKFVDRLRDGAELVMGNRLAGEIKPGAMPWHHRWIGNPVLSRFLNVLFNTGVGDSHCGLRGFTKDGFRRMGLKMPGMEMASEMVIKSSMAGLRIEETPITLWPDGRDRPPHLRSFRDGWRHLRFMLMCSPFFLFMVPGLLLMAVGLIAIPVAAAAGYGDYDRFFGPNFLYATSIASIVGMQLLVFGALAKVYTHQVEPAFQDPRFSKLMSWFTVERGLLFGLSLLILGLIFGTAVGLHWLQTSRVPQPWLLIFSGTLLTMGTEAMFASFLIGIIDLPMERTEKANGITKPRLFVGADRGRILERRRESLNRRCESRTCSLLGLPNVARLQWPHT